MPLNICIESSSLPRKLPPTENKPIMAFKDVRGGDRLANKMIPSLPEKRLRKNKTKLFVYLFPLLFFVVVGERKKEKNLLQMKNTHTREKPLN